CTVGEIAEQSPMAQVHELQPPWSSPAAPFPVHGLRPSLAVARPIMDTVEMPAMRAFDVPGGVVFGTDGGIGPDAETLAIDFPSMFEIDDRERRRLAAQARAAGTRQLPGTTVSLLQQSPGNFAHWLVQGLPRLALLRRVVDLGGADQVLVNR